eukprot:gnl/MRDRNA2_/MRDRNA2_86157_c0_seq5.p1 gnl/MRDRNA2_/MRDRNA2_86157_c0~~gnl/MRDRNA2_/MRDRNA2_86157_c0_seq5.p1  ORF type:complete len:119 (+),score=5.99 gnl/MRDRNA2_/MRDRNA2_86157_c0_seq5:644-1000(+)
MLRGFVEWQFCDLVLLCPLDVMSQFLPKNLCNPAWAWSFFSIPDCPLRAAISAQAIPLLSAAELHDLSMTAWSFAVREYAHVPLLTSISSKALKLITDGNPLNLAQTVWAVATRVCYD